MAVWQNKLFWKTYLKLRACEQTFCVPDLHRKQQEGHQEMQVLLVSYERQRGVHFVTEFWSFVPGNVPVLFEIGFRSIIRPPFPHKQKDVLETWRISDIFAPRLRCKFVALRVEKLLFDLKISFVVEALIWLLLLKEKKWTENINQSDLLQTHDY